MEAQPQMKAIGLKELVSAYEEARENQKYCIFFDKTQGNVATFFHYKQKLRDFNKECMKVQIGNKTAKEAVEVIREAVMWGGKFGDAVAINMDHFKPDFKGEFNFEGDDEVKFSPNLIFDFQLYRKDYK